MINYEADRVTAILSHPVFIQKLNIIKDKEKDRIFCGHGEDHLIEVARIAQILNLSEQKNADRDLLYATALLHDIGRCEEGEHEKNGAVIAKEILCDLAYSGQEVDIICNAIELHRHNSKLPKTEVDIITELIRRADKLSRKCFMCKAREECYWDEDRKNRSLF